MLALVLAVAPARADDATTVHATTDVEPRPDTLVPLPLPPPALRVSIDTLELETLGTDHRYALDPSTQLELHGDWLEAGAATHTWNARARLSRRIGGFDVALDLGAGHVVSDLAEGVVREGSYTFVGVSLTRSIQLSRTVTGFISLTAGLRHWLGNRAPPGEGDAAQVMLWIGAHF